MTLSYDVWGRLSSTTSGGATTAFNYFGQSLVGETDPSKPIGNMIRGYVLGPGDEPLMLRDYGRNWTINARPIFKWFHQDRLGSVIATSDSGGAMTPLTYGPYGEPQTWSGSRLRYTGQMAIPEAQLYHYRARAYDPVLGRFLQTDPIGYEAGTNVYAYVGDDPMNATDPSGLRPLTPGEFNILSQIFGDSIDYRVIDIKDGVSGDALAWGALILGDRGAITLGNSIYVNPGSYQTNYAVGDGLKYLGTLIHEVAHVFQNQNYGLKPYDYAANSLGTPGDEYDITWIKKNTRWDDLTYEQQASVFAAWGKAMMAGDAKGHRKYGRLVQEAISRYSNPTLNVPMDGFPGITGWGSQVVPGQDLGNIFFGVRPGVVDLGDVCLTVSGPCS